MKKYMSGLQSLCPVVVGLIGSVFCALDSSGQGLITFGNTVPIYDIDNTTPLAGAGFLAELYAAAPGNSLVPISASLTPFSAAPGYFFDATSVAVPGVPPGGNAIVQVVAWRASDGATFAEANHPGAHVGASAVFDAIGLGSLGPPPSTPASLSGMQSFSLQVVVPEPPVSALGLAGATALLLWRRMPKVPGVKLYRTQSDTTNTLRRSSGT